MPNPVSYESNRYAQIQGVNSPTLVYKRNDDIGVTVLEDIEIVVAFTTAFAWSLKASATGPDIMLGDGSIDPAANQHYFQWTGKYVMYPNEELWVDITGTGGPASLDISVSGHDEPWPAPMYPTALGG